MLYEKQCDIEGPDDAEEINAKAKFNLNADTNSSLAHCYS